MKLAVYPHKRDGTIVYFTKLKQPGTGNKWYETGLTSLENKPQDKQNFILLRYYYDLKQYVFEVHLGILKNINSTSSHFNTIQETPIHV